MRRGPRLRLARSQPPRPQLLSGRGYTPVMRHDSPLSRTPHVRLGTDAHAWRACSGDIVRIPSTKPVAVRGTLADLARGVNSRPAHDA